MGLFVMINQPTKNRVRVLLCARAHASVRPVLSLHPFLPRSRLCFATPLRPSLPQRLPGLVKTHCTARFAQLDVLVTIPIDDRHGFTQRFSPTGFILNALDSTD